MKYINYFNEISIADFPEGYQCRQVEKVDSIFKLKKWAAS
jgi:hypothetical protein